MVARTLALALLTFTVVSAPLPAWSNDVPLSKAHFRRAVNLAERGSHAEAIREFELAYEANPRPSMLYNIAHEYEALSADGSVNHMRKSVDYYQRYLMVSPAASDRRIVEATITELKARIRSADDAARPLPRSTMPAAPALTEPPSTAATAKSDSTRVGPVLPGAKKLPSWAWAPITIGGVVIAGIAIGLGVGLSDGSGPPDSSLGAQGARYP